MLGSPIVHLSGLDDAEDAEALRTCYLFQILLPGRREAKSLTAG